MTNHPSAATGGMSPYERRRWAELEEHWAKADQRRGILPAKVRHGRNTAHDWSWTDTGGSQIAGKPTAVVDLSGRIYVFVATEDGHLWKLGRNTAYEWA